MVVGEVRGYFLLFYTVWVFFSFFSFFYGFFEARGTAAPY
jgi:hypothetical protein